MNEWVKFNESINGLALNRGRKSIKNEPSELKCHKSAIRIDTNIWVVLNENE